MRYPRRLPSALQGAGLSGSAAACEGHSRGGGGEGGSRCGSLALGELRSPRETRLPKGKRLPGTGLWARPAASWGSRAPSPLRRAGRFGVGNPREEKRPLRRAPSLSPGRYFNIERGKNMCGLADCASFPVPLL